MRLNAASWPEMQRAVTNVRLGVATKDEVRFVEALAKENDPVAVEALRDSGLLKGN